MADRDALLLPLSPKWGEGPGVRGEIDPVPAPLKRLLALSPLAPTLPSREGEGTAPARFAECESFPREDGARNFEPNILQPRRLILRVF